jgi:hypothetical protein
MARSRIIKPGFFRNEDLAELPAMTRLLFAGLWTLADKEGRLEDRPKRIRADVFPYDDLTGADVHTMLHELAAGGFIQRKSGVIVIERWHWWQSHDRECSPATAASRRDLWTAEWKRLRRKVIEVHGTTCAYCGIDCGFNATVDHVIPVSAGGKNEFSNLKVACRSCNSRKGGVRKRRPQ